MSFLLPPPPHPNHRTHRLTDELQALLPNLRGPQLLKSVSCIANLGFVRSSKQQQLADQLLQQVSQQLLTPGVLLELPGLINSLAEAEATQSQPGLGAFIKKLQAVQDSREGALHAAAPVAVLGLVAGLQQHGKLEDGLELLPELQARALHSMRELCTSVAAGTAAAHAAAAAAVLAGAQEGAMQEALRLEQEQQQLIRALGLREWVLLVEAVRQLCGNSRSSSAGGASNSGDGSQATGDASLPVGAEEVALLLQAMIDTELLHCRVEQAAAAPPPPPPPASSNSNANNQQQQQVPAANGAVTPPPPPPPPAAATAAVRSNDGGASSDGGGSRAQAVLLPVVFGADDWRNLARLMTVCLEWYPLELLPLQLLQLMLEVRGYTVLLHACSSMSCCAMLAPLVQHLSPLLPVLHADSLRCPGCPPTHVSAACFCVLWLCRSWRRRQHLGAWPPAARPLQCSCSGGSASQEPSPTSCGTRCPPRSTLPPPATARLTRRRCSACLRRTAWLSCATAAPHPARSSCRSWCLQDRPSPGLCWTPQQRGAGSCCRR